METEAGVAVTPIGRPLSATETVPLKPFIAFAVTVRFCDALLDNVTVLADRVSVKLPGLVVPPPPPAPPVPVVEPPQPARKKTHAANIT